MRTIGKLFTFIIIVGAIVIAYLTFARNTTFNGAKKYLYVRPGGASAEAQITQQLKTGKVIDNVKIFQFLAPKMNAFKNLTAGRLAVPKGTSVYGLIKILKADKQDTIHFTIKRVRTREGLAGMMGKNLMTDSAATFMYLSNNDSLRQFGVDTFTLNTLLIPGTYNLKWQYTTAEVLRIFAAAKKAFWSRNNRIARAAALGLTPAEASTLASIVEDETLKDSEKDTIASVYLNRLRAGMALGADPTIKYALKDFNMQRILNQDLKVQSPYNTYINKGLPPGPICTPDSVTIEAVLNAPKTDYLYFVAKPDFSGYHNFSTDYSQHLKLAQQFHDALDKKNIK
ncbi:endolytic transglycosylase MltG [Arachidicoccus terrestris]|uniref:endolytic transglycosylase MltG n=1 Tax=Arachidicoccus terrestris TaxID=2875539 RepID=UPI001CC4F155|nr:endolytic transglycosylase MltG [Arachidicoccus terrestris]UAY54075.1 endolytic transglycosylase MltG [Arachidicoccus terrestris]